MFNLKQWINWHPVQVQGEIKVRKVPSNGIDIPVWNGTAVINGINHLNPVNWVDYDAVISRSILKGFVFTEQDSYIVIDIDHALQADGTWSQLAYTVLAMFPGAYVEVSYSGDGLHIIAQGIMPEGFKHKNSALGLEIYDRARYIAITGTSATGSPDINHQTAINTFVQFYMEQAIVLTGAGWTNIPRMDWNGPEDDDELIKRMLNARPSINSLWGSAATIEDLWNNNIATFIECYPDNSEIGYDLSSPDMALASHLAFWTGCNCERIERLMWRSGLVRDKWTHHPTYLREFTIVKAAGACPNVYSDPRTSNQPTAPVDLGQMTFDVEFGTIRQGDQYLTPDAQLEYFKGCVYIINTHRILRPNGTIVSPEVFKVIYGGYDFSMDNQNTKTTKCAWEVFTKSRTIKFPIVEGVLFRPELKPFAIIEQDGLTYINTYCPISIRLVDGDVSPFLELMFKLFPNDRDRLIILSYMAACLQHIGVKFQWCPMIQGEEGNGKTFMTRALIYAIGERYSHLPNPKDIANKFNYWIEGCLFAGVEEVYTSDKRDNIDALKILITNERMEIHPKGGNQYMGDNRVNFMMNSNHKDAIRKTKNDRRYAPFFTPHQSYEDIVKDGMGGDYFPNLYSWARKDGYAIIANYLTNFIIPDEFNPATKCHRAPETSSTVAAIVASQGPVEQEIENAIGEGVQGFRNGWVSAKALELLLERTGKARMIHRNKRAEMLQVMGYVTMGRSTVEILQERGRPMLYMLEGTPNTGDVTSDYMRAQGYINP